MLQFVVLSTLHFHTKAQNTINQEYLFTAQHRRRTLCDVSWGAVTWATQTGHRDYNWAL